MTGPDTIRDIIRTYEKHGWILRRLLLTHPTADALSPEDTLKMHAVDRRAEIDMAWFSRPSRPGGIPWELRYLGEPPFALLENIDEESDDFEDTLKAVETRLKDAVAVKRNGLTSE